MLTGCVSSGMLFAFLLEETNSKNQGGVNTFFLIVYLLSLNIHL